MSKLSHLMQQPQNYEEYPDDEYIEQALAQMPQEYSEDQDYGQQMPSISPQQMQAMQSQMQQGMQPQQQVQERPFNPYYDGIRNAIAEARQSFKSSNKQQNRALRQGILAFGNSIGGMEREKGFKNNLLAAGRALAPAITEYDKMNTADEASNQALADKMLEFKAAEEAAQEKRRQAMMDDNFRREQLAETIRHNKAYEGLQGQRSLISDFANNQQSENGNNEVLTILNDAERLIRKSGDDTQFGGFSQLAKDTPIIGRFINKNSQQAAIDTMGDVLRGKLFNAWGYRNQAEFEHVPSISSLKSPAENLAIIKELQARFGNITALDDVPIDDIDNIDMVTMRSPNGNIGKIPQEAVESAIRKGYEIVQ